MTRRKRIIGNLPELVAQAQRLGYTHVLTFGGPVALKDWKPYSHTIPPLDFELVGEELRERNGDGYWKPEYTVIGNWLLVKGVPKCVKCRKPIKRGEVVYRAGSGKVQHSRCKP